MDYAGVVISTQYFPCFLFKRNWIDEARWKTELQKAHEVLAGAKECQVKILSAKLALCGTQRWKQAGAPCSGTPRSPEESSVRRAVSDCQSQSKNGTEPARNEGFREPGSAGPKQPHMFRAAPIALHSASLLETSSAKEDLSPRCQLYPDTPTHAPTTAGRIFSTLGKRE